MSKLKMGLSIFFVLSTVFVGFYFLSNIKPEPQGGDFTLDSMDGPIALHDFKGHWVVLYFGYASCPDICPTDLARWNRVFQALETEHNLRLNLIFISVDFERDKPELLAQYARYFNPSFKAATGNEAIIKQVSKQYGVTWEKAYQPNSFMGYSIDHSTYSYLINPNGKLVRMFKQSTSVEALVHETQKQISEFNPDTIKP